MARDGWSKLRAGDTGYKAGAERYRDPSGHVVSRRQYDNARYTDAGWRNRADFERRYNDPTYRYLMDRIVTNEARERGVERRTARLAVDRPDSRINRELLKAREVGYGKRRAGRSQRGPMAKLLARAGLRDPNATYAVGATPPRSSRGGRR